MILRKSIGATALTVVATAGSGICFAPPARLHGITSTDYVRTSASSNLPLALFNLRNKDPTSEVVANDGKSTKTKVATTSQSTKQSLNEPDTTGMPDFASFFKKSSTVEAPMAKTSKAVSDFSDTETSNALDLPTLAAGVVVALATVVTVVCSLLGYGPDDVIQGIQAFFSNPQDTLQGALEFVADAGPAGPVYFGFLYFLAEIFAVPATPLTLSAGYFFGLTQGVTTVLIAATLAACVGFVVGKTVLRGTVENILKENPKYAKLDKAIGEKGFPLLLLVRLTPIFPFSISNYVYGASSIKFPAYFFGTLLGFFPGTCLYVYSGMVGQALTTGQGDEPWYVYVGALALFGTLLKLVTDVATNIVEALEDEE